MMNFTAPDGRTLQWVLRSQAGPLALLAARLHAAGSDFQRRQRGHGSGADGNTEDNDMDESE
jgi:type VI secretion system protein ImpL